MRRAVAIALLLLAAACEHTGDLGEHCNPDGTCNAPRLECRVGHYILAEDQYHCVLR